MMPALRYLFTVEARDGQAAVMLECGQGIYRCRLMSYSLLQRIVCLCDDIRRETIPACRRRRRFVCSVPTYPMSAKVATSNIAGVCDVSVVASLDDESGTVEFCVALYDEGCSDWPVLVLVNEQLDEFIERASEVLLNAEI